MRTVGLLLMLAAPAWAVDTTVVVQGRAFDDAGQPYRGTFQARFRIYDDALRTTTLHDETIDAVVFEDGTYRVELGAQVGFPLSTSDLTSPDAWIGVVVDADEEQTLSPVGAIGHFGAVGRADEVRQDCAAHLAAGFSASGEYWIDPDGAGAREPYKIWCDQQTSGGGWMRFSLETRNWGNSLGFDTVPTPYGADGTRVSGANSTAPLDNLTVCSGDSDVVMTWKAVSHVLTLEDIDAVNTFATQGFTGSYWIYDADGGADWDQIKGCRDNVVYVTADGDEFPGGADQTWVGPYAFDSITGLMYRGRYGGNADASGYNVALPRYWYIR